MAKKAKIKTPNTPAAAPQVEGMTIDEIIAEYNKIVDSKLVILVNAFELAAKELGFKTTDYLLKVLNFVPVENTDPQRFKQMLTDEPQNNTGS